MCCVGGEVMPLFAQIKVRFYQGRPPENLNYRHKGRKQEKLQDDDICAGPLWEPL